jgi:nucleotide-binding universal stress UspA family protein
MERIVVGIDGSAGARAALDWAIDEARHHGAEVRAVHVWDIPQLGWAAFDRMLGDPDLLEAEARRELDLVVDAADVTGLDAPVQRSLRCGRPAEWLLREAKAGDLIVVGSRGLGGYDPPPLGSVSRQVAGHAPCPVVVVPAPAG